MASMRKMKNVVKNYSPAEVKVREATSNDPWGPSSSVMSEIADLTYNVVAFSEIMTMIWKRINDHGKNWRHVYKALVLLDYIIKTGSERVAQQCKENIFAIQTLKDFHFYDKDGKDQGLNVREKSKALVSLLKDDERLKTERERALKAKERFAMASQGVGSGHHDEVEIGKPASETTNPERPQATTELEQARPHTAGEEELQLQLAIAMSKEEAQKNEMEQKHDDLRLQMALSQSADEDSSQRPPDVPPAQQTTSTLLNLVETPPQSAPQPDPWGVQPSIPPANDPWGVPTAVSSAPVIANDPWGSAPPQPSLSQQSVPSNDPWSVPTPAQQPVPKPDPWGAQPVAQPPPGDPWAPQNSMAPAKPPQDPDNEFDFLRNDGLLTSSSATMSQSAPPPFYPPQTNGSAGVPPKTQTKPEDFLGENSNLVNLDSLVGPVHKGPALTASNPFLMSGMTPAASGGMQQPVSNPFHQQRAPAPTINQMRQQPFQQTNVPSGSFQTSFPTAGHPNLPPPLIPASSAPQTQQNPFM